MGLIKNAMSITLALPLAIFVRRLRSKWIIYKEKPKELFPHGNVLKGSLVVGKGTIMGKQIEIDCTGNVVIGDFCVISPGVKIITHTHDFNEGCVPIIAEEKGIKATSIKIGNNVSIGEDAMILPQTKEIGDYSIIGARAVVTKQIGEGEIWAGNPARMIGRRQENA